MVLISYLNKSSVNLKYTIIIVALVILFNMLMLIAWGGDRRNGCLDIVIQCTTIKNETKIWIVATYKHIF